MESADSHSWLLMALWLSHRSTAQLYIWTTLAVLSFDLLNFTSCLAHWHHKRIPQTAAGLHRWHSRKLRLSASRVHLNSATGDWYQSHVFWWNCRVPTPLTIPSSRVPPLMKHWSSPIFPPAWCTSHHPSVPWALWQWQVARHSPRLYPWWPAYHSHHYQLQRTCPPIWRIPGRSGKLLNCLSRYSTS